MLLIMLLVSLSLSAVIVAYHSETLSYVVCKYPTYDEEMYFIVQVGGPRNNNNNDTASSTCYFTCQPRVRTNLRGFMQSICSMK
jgi:hypothetical protein